MRHVGQEFRLVAAALFEIARLLLQGGLRAGEVVALGLQFLRLGFELGVGLLQLGLLQFEARLRVLQRPGLGLQLVVGGAQFVALGAELGGLLLGLFQQAAQGGAIFGRANRGRDHRA